MRSQIIFTLILFFTLSLSNYGEEDPYLSLAISIQNAAKAANQGMIEQCFDIREACLRIRNNIDGNEAHFHEFSRIFRDGLSKISSNICEWDRLGEFSLLRVRKYGNDRLAVFRTVNEFGLNYQELLLRKAENGAVNVIDMRSQVAGEFMSELMQPIYLSSLRDFTPENFKRVTNGKPTILDVMPQIQEMRKAVSKKDFEKVIRIYNNIPGDLRNWKPLHLMRITASAKLDDAQWLKAIDDFKRLYPDDDATKHQLIDRYIIQKDFAAALIALDDLDRAIEGDPYLNVVRSNVYMAWGKPNKAIEMAAKAVDALPDMKAPYIALFDAQFESFMFADAVKTLEKIDIRFGINTDVFEKDPVFSEFCKSPAFKLWNEERKSRKTERTK